jgi:hypothetical protein
MERDYAKEIAEHEERIKKSAKVSEAEAAYQAVVNKEIARLRAEQAKAAEGAKTPGKLVVRKILDGSSVGIIRVSPDNGKTFIELQVVCGRHPVESIEFIEKTFSDAIDAATAAEREACIEILIRHSEYGAARRLRESRASSPPQQVETGGDAHTPEHRARDAGILRDAALKLEEAPYFGTAEKVRQIAAGLESLPCTDYARGFRAGVEAQGNACEQTLIEGDRLGIAEVIKSVPLVSPDAPQPSEKENTL